MAFTLAQAISRIGAHLPLKASAQVNCDPHPPAPRPALIDAASQLSGPGETMRSTKIDGLRFSIAQDVAQEIWPQIYAHPQYRQINARTSLPYSQKTTSIFTEGKIGQP